LLLTNPANNAALDMNNQKEYNEPPTKLRKVGKHGDPVGGYGSSISKDIPSGNDWIDEIYDEFAAVENIEDLLFIRPDKIELSENCKNHIVVSRLINKTMFKYLM
jgi:hypothetical protein